LGEAGELTVERIEAEPAFDGLDVSLAALRVEGLRLDVDLTGAAPPLGSLQPALERLVRDGGGQADGDDDAAAPTEPAPGLPRIVIENGTLNFATTIGPLTGSLNGNLDADGGRFALVLPGEAEYLEVTASARRDPAAMGGPFAVALDGELRTAGALARLLALPGPAVTAGTLVVEVAGEAEPDGSRVALHGDAVLGGVALADGTTGISAHLPLAAEIAGDRLTVTLDEEALLRVEQPSRDSLRGLGVPEDLLPLLASGLNLTLASGGDLPFRLAASPIWPPRQAEFAVAAQAASDQGLALSARSQGAATFGDDLALAAYDGRLEAHAEADRLAFGGREARDVAVTLPLAVAYGADGLHLALQSAGALDIHQFGSGAPLRLQRPLSLAVEELAIDADPAATGYRYRLRAAEDRAALTIGAGAEAVPVTAGGVRASLSGGFSLEAGHDADLELRFAGLGLPGYDFTAEAATVTVALDRELRPETSRFSLGPFQVGGEEPLTAPLALAGNLERAGDGYDIAAELGLAGGQTLADLAGRYRDNGRASLEATSRLLSFAPDGLQPAALSPLLADLEDVKGTVTASARLAWPRAPASESGKLGLSNLSFTSGGTRVDGLDLALELDSLLPLASAAGQRLTVRSLEAGVPVETIELIFSLDQVPRPQLNVEDGGFALGGARWRIEPTVLDPAAARNDVTLTTEALDLATFFELIGVDGLSGSGRLTGSLPVAFAGGDVIVENGQFNALEPGRLSIRFAALRSALAGGGEVVEAAVKALEDFHYDELTLSIAKTADNDATVKLSTLGQNPEVMDGQPFRFNINLESNLTSVLEALRQGYSLSDDALRRAWQLRQ
ncbi:MAG: YdbH domain-containing protein, partial [Bacteroidota bacterium]